MKTPHRPKEQGILQQHREFSMFAIPRIEKYQIQSPPTVGYRKQMKNISSNSCTLHQAFKVLGKKWTILVLQDLHYNKELSFNQIRNGLGRITNKILSQRLQQLEKLEIVKKEVSNQAPGSVKYFITKKGEGLTRIFNTAKKWGIKYNCALPSCLDSNCNNCSKYRESLENKKVY